MKPEPIIRSRSNTLLKRVGAVLAGKERDSIVLEGDRLVNEAMRVGWELEALLIAANRLERAAELASAGIALRLVEPGLLDRISALETSPGILALAAHPPQRSLEELAATGASLVLVVAGVADPGNLGALSRTAEAAGAGAIVALRGGARAFGPKALRGSMGSLLRLPVFEGYTAEEVEMVLRTTGYRQVRAATRGGKDWRELDWSGLLALWISGETNELPEITREFEGATISMAGEVESLNITVAASLLLFAAGEER